MNGSLQRQLNELDREIKALKTVYDKTATNLPTFTKRLTFNTLENKMVEKYSDGYEYEFSGEERIIVEFRTNSGSNTLADLEFTFSQDGFFVPKFHRIPFAGGVAWEVNGMPDSDEYNNWKATTYNFTVNSVVDGTLTARMIWQA